MMTKAESSRPPRATSAAKPSPQPVERRADSSADAAQPAPKTSSSEGLDAFLKELSSGIAARIEQAKAAVEAKADELAEAERALATLLAIKAVQDGSFRLPAPDARPARSRAARAAGGGPTGVGGGRAPRGEIPKRVFAVLQAAGPAGLLPADVFARLEVNEAEKQSVRNYLASGKKAGKLVQNKDKRYSVPT